MDMIKKYIEKLSDLSCKDITVKDLGIRELALLSLLKEMYDLIKGIEDETKNI